MLSRDDLHEYQGRGERHIIRQPSAALWMEVGTGKTITSLSAIEWLIASGRVYGALVIAPLRICQAVWRQEARNWEHTTGLKFVNWIGPRAVREHNLTLDAHIYLINYENLPWLEEELTERFLKKGKYFPFNMVVFDEVSKMSNSTSKRVRAFMKLFPYTTRRIGLTGTPATNGLIKLHGQYLSIDGGARLTPYKSHYEGLYFERDYMGYNLTLRPGAEEKIRSQIQDITFQVQAKDYLQLPRLNVQDVVLPWKPKAYDIYREMENELFIELDEGEVEAFNQAARTLKCLQICNGAVYVEDNKHSEIHDTKLDALEDIIEEMSGSPLLVCYCYRHDAQRIKHRFPKAVDVRDDSADVIVKRVRSTIAAR